MYLDAYVKQEFRRANLLRLPPTLEHKDVSIDVLHADPAGQRQGRVRPHPVHHSPQLRQEGNQAEPAIAMTSEPSDTLTIRVIGRMTDIPLVKWTAFI